MSAPEAPPKIAANDLLAAHGPTGWLIHRLQRYALLGWALFLITLLLHFVTVLVGQVSPRPVVAVDASGKVLGTLEFLSPTSRSDQELLAATMRFAHNYLSLNSDTIFNDYADAMNIMSPELTKATSEALKKDNYLGRVAAAHTRSWLEWGMGEAAPRVVARNGLDAEVRLRGTLVVQNATGKVEKPFDISLNTSAVARNSYNTAGITITARRDN
jgi:hypothetical protein